MAKKVLIILVDGVEEVEAVTPIDILRRAGLDVVTAGLDKKEVTGSHQIQLRADILLQDYPGVPDALVLPGGPGAETLGRSKTIQSLIQKTLDAKKHVAAICAAPAEVLGRHGFLEGKKATCFPGCEGSLGRGAVFVKDRVVTDGAITTSRGPGTAMEFSLELVRILVSPDKARELSEKILAQ